MIMVKTQSIDSDKNQYSALFILFSVWSFILLCRPQDYLLFLGSLRPTLVVGVFTLLIYLLNPKEDYDKIFNSKQFRLFIYFLIIMIIGVPFSYYRSASLKDILNYGSIHVLFFLLFYQLVNSIQKIRLLLFSCCCGASIYAIFVLVLGEFSQGRIAYGNMFDPNDIAFFIICFIAFNLLFLSKDNTSFVKLISIANLIICVIVLLKSGSRSGFLACSTLFAYLFFVKTTTVNISLVKKLVLAMTVIVVLLSFNMLSERYRTILDVQDDYNVTAETGRITIWKIGLRLMMAKPLTGVGMNRFNEGVGRDREARGLLSTQWQAPHNSIVQVGAETGVFGLLLFCVMSFNVFNITGKIRDNSRSEKLIRIAEMTRAGFIGHIVSAMFLGQAYSVYWIFYIILSAVLQRLLEKEQPVHESTQIKSSLYTYADHIRRS